MADDVEYAALVDIYRRLAATESTNEKTAVLAEAFAAADAERLSMVVALVRGTVFPAWRSAELGVSSGLTLRALRKATGVADDRIEDRWRETGDLGDAAAWAVDHQRQQTLVSPTLTIRRVYETLRELPEYEGAGSRDRRIDAVAGLVSDADPDEARYVVRTALGHLRLGVGSGTVRDAIALAFLDGADATAEAAVGESAPPVPADAAVAAVERAHQVTNDFPLVAETARDGGRAALADLDVELFRPVEVVLARKAESVEAALADVADDPGDVLLERKFDGARLQLHKDGDEVRAFTRRLLDVSEQFPDVVRAVRERVTVESCVLDAEAVGLDPETGEPVPFQRFSKRIRQEEDVEALADEIPAVVYLFDCLCCEGSSLLDAPLRDRLDRLDAAFEPEAAAIERAANLRPAAEAGESDADAARAFYREALAAGHEGVMAKNLAASYQPGRRVGTTMKVKPVMEPLDLVVTRAQWSEGRRSDFLGRLFLGCYDPDADAFPEVGRLATGYTDEELRDLTARLEPLVVERDGRRVDLRPEVVLEIEYEEIQPSTEYGSGYALRFPRFSRFRSDLSPEDADTLARVESLYEDR
jgi:DNA ligase-1